MRTINMDDFKAEIIQEVIDGLDIKLTYCDGEYGMAGQLYVDLLYNGEEIASGSEDLPSP